MRYHAIRTVFYSSIAVFIITATLGPQGIQGTIAKKAVKILQIIRLVTRKELALSMTKKLILIFHVSPLSFKYFLFTFANYTILE